MIIVCILYKIVNYAFDHGMIISKVVVHEPKVSKLVQPIFDRWTKPIELLKFILNCGVAEHAGYIYYFILYIVVVALECLSSSHSPNQNKDQYTQNSLEFFEKKMQETCNQEINGNIFAPHTSVDVM